jgi:transposase
MGRSRGGLTTKIHALVDAEGRPIDLVLTAGQAHDGKPAVDMLEVLQPDTILLADRAYDSDAIRSLAARKRAWANIPPKKNRTGTFPFSQWVYKKVSAVPVAPFARGREERCSEPLRASTHDDFRAYA